jgi:hypothetical protein
LSGIFLFIDSISDGVAKLIGERRGELFIERDELPEGSGEGDWLRVSLFRDEEKRREYEDEIGRAETGLRGLD